MSTTKGYTFGYYDKNLKLRVSIGETDIIIVTSATDKLPHITAKSTRFT